VKTENRCGQEQGKTNEIPKRAAREAGPEGWRRGRNTGRGSPQMDRSQLKERKILDKMAGGWSEQNYCTPRYAKEVRPAGKVLSGGSTI